jgi:20S proteasome subunit alpha 3
MSRKYDSYTTLFTPEGRLLQVEYAISNIEKAGLCLGVTTKGGVVLATEKETTSKLLETNKSSDKIYKIDKNIAVGVAGLSGDANLLIDWARHFSQNYYIKYKNNTPVENVVRFIGDEQQIKTQKGSNRPYGAGFLYAGWDRLYGYQLYNIEPSGVFNCWKAHAIGQNSKNSQSSFKQYYDENISLEDGITLAARILRKSLDKNKITGENIEIFVLTHLEGEFSQRFLDVNTINEHLKKVDLLEEEEKKNKK